MPRRTLTLLALLAVGLSSACGSRTPSGETITGTVLVAPPLVPGNFSVGIYSGGGLQTVQVNADATFRVTGVTVPYDAMVYSTDYGVALGCCVALGGGVANVFQGLTVLHPALTVPGQSPVPGQSFGLQPRSATVQGAVTGLTGTGIENASLGFSKPLGGSSDILFLEAPGQTFGQPIGWSGPATVTGDLYFFVSHIATYASPLCQCPECFYSVYDGFAVLPGINLTDGDTVTGLDAGLQQVASTRLVTATLAYPAGFVPTLFVTSLVVHPGPGSGFQLLDVASQTCPEQPVPLTGFVVGAPELPGIPLQLQTFGNGADSSEYMVTQTVSSLDAGIRVSFPAPAQLTAPAEQATLRQASAAFQWTSVTGAAIYLVNVVGSRGVLTIYTTQSSAMLPDTSQLALPALGTASWRVTSFDTPSSVDDLVGDAGLGVLYLGDSVQTKSPINDVVLE